MKAIRQSFERYEKKYFLTPAQYKLLKERLNGFIKADEYPTYTLCNIYYDTDDYRLIRASLEKPMYKEKLRVRSYGVPDDNSNVFVELKKKYDGVVYKRRITSTPLAAQSLLKGFNQAGQTNQISNEISYFQRFYNAKPKVFISYDREAYKGIDNPDLRITFDTNMRFRLDNLDLRSGDYGEPIIQTEKILMEIKIPGVCPLWLSRLLSEFKIYPISFSKYGECYKNHILKNNKNIFAKEALLSA
ncbi:MAG: polyphosphate polymerase domain-containing protein [Clostridia bacterium]|nr:polyphosphate polymerase domain-containing protein [Clostridia bacterium]